MTTATVGRLDEVHVSVKDMEAARRFYIDVLGFEEEFYHDGKMCGLRTGGAALVLTASQQAASGVRLVLACEDIERLVDILSSRGVTITQPLWEGHRGARLAGFEDPEGNSIILEEPSPANAHSDH